MRAIASRETRLRIATDAWHEALFDMYNPAVPDPEFSFSPDHEEPFYIDMERWTVHMNLTAVPDLDDAGFHRFVRSMSHHELGHYTTCPYDGVTNALMLQAASREVGIELGPIACNIVSDLIIEAGLKDRFPGLTRERFDASLVDLASRFGGDRQPSLTWKVIVLAEARVTGFPLPGAVQAAVDFSDAVADAAKIARMILKDGRDVQKWPSLARRVARVMKPHLASEFPIDRNAGGAGTNPDPASGFRATPGSDDGHVYIPPEVLQHSGDVSKVSDRDNGRLGERALRARRSKRRGRGSGSREQPATAEQAPDAAGILEELAKHSRNVGDFGGPATALGLVRSEQVLATWYRFRSKGLVRVDVLVRKQTGQLPVTTETWRLGDPIESLDLALTVLNSPVIIPNVTTRRWEHRYQSGTFPGKDCPDFLIAIDSSYSMGWHPAAVTEAGRGPYDVALVAAFAAVHHARRKGVKLAAINFSGGHTSVSWTRDTSAIENVLLRYEGDGTVLPTPAIIEMVRAREGGGKVLVFIISDAGLHDWQGSVPPLMDLASEGHGIVLFLIGGNPRHLEQKRFKVFMAKGGKIHCIASVHDLVGLVVKEIRDAYRE